MAAEELELTEHAALPKRFVHVRWLCAAVVMLHLLTVTISVYIASIAIQTILTSGWVCSGTGLLLAIVAGSLGRRSMILAGLSTMLLAGALFVVENVLHLGPTSARDPFCMVFLAYELLLLPWCLLAIRKLVHPATKTRAVAGVQFGLQSLVVMTAAVAAVLAAARWMLDDQADGLTVAAMTTLGMTVVALLLVIYSSVRSPTLPRCTSPYAG